MQHAEFDLQEAIAVLERTPASLRALLAGLPERWLRATEGDGTWTPYDVIGHLVYAERTNWIPRARHILAGDGEPFQPFDRTVHPTKDSGESVDERLASFAELRRENIAALMDMNLNQADLARTGQHPEFGEVRLGQLLATWVVHDLAHTAQIARLMAKVYADAVGPWSVLLRVLRDRE